MVRYLLAREADVNARASYGRTPLHNAAGRDSVEIGRLLLEHGADPKLEFNGRPVLGGSDEFRKLLKEYSINQ